MSSIAPSVCQMCSSRITGTAAFVAAAALSIGVVRARTSPRYISTHRSDSAIGNIEKIVQRDEGKRGIGPLCLTGELARAADKILSANRIAIITGFPCMLDYTPPTETDGPLGALSIARACLAAGKSVTLITDECNEEVVLGAASASGLNLGRSNEEAILTLESFPGGSNFDITDEERLFSLAQEIDLVIAIERAGPSHDGTYRTMRKRDMTGIVAPLDRLLTGDFTCVDESIRNEFKRMYKSRVGSIGIGDGGNEVGMGKVYEKIVSSTIPNAADIACVVKADDLIVASVSNWGGYALSAAVAVAGAREDRKVFKSVAAGLTACLPSDAQETAICQRMIDCGARDGISGKLDLFVDGMPLSRSLEVMNELIDTAKKA